MNTITSLFQQAQLAEAAYASFFDNAKNLITDNAGVITALTTGDGKFSEAQATEKQKGSPISRPESSE